MAIEETMRSALNSLNTGHFIEAENIYKEVLSIDPDNIEANHFLGLAYYNQNKFEPAIQHIVRALQLKPDNVDAYNNLGIIFQDLGQMDNALSCFNKALQVNPHSFESCINLGNTLQAKGSIDEALIYYQRAILLKPDNDEIYFALALVYQQKKQFMKAVNCCLKAFELNPANTKGYYILGTVFLSAGEVNKCLDCYSKFLKIDSNTSDLPVDVGTLLDESNLIPHKKKAVNSYDSSILICVSAFNRKEITELSLSQTKRYKAGNCHFVVYDDHSTEYNCDFLRPYCDEVIYLQDKMGIHNLRMYQFRKFMETDFDFLYMTDNDVIHDPNYLSVLQELYEKGKRRLPVCLFNSRVHMVPDNILLHENGILLKRLASGVSMFYDREMVAKIVSVADKADEDHEIMAWDYRVMTYLNLPWVTSETSYLEHFGARGVNNFSYGADRAINPTKYLQERWTPITDFLKRGGELRVSF